jgi:hypothetical protein
MFWARDYKTKFLEQTPSNIRRLWSLEDLSGNAKEYTRFGEDGTVSSATQAGGRSQTGAPCYTFDGVDDHVAIGNNLGTDIGPWDVGTVFVWARITDSAVLTDGIARRMLNIQTDGSNALIMRKSATNNTIFINLVIDGTGESKNITMSDTNWHCYVVRWSTSTGNIEYFMDGVSQGTNTTVNTWQGNITNGRIGRGTGGGERWSGDIGIVALYEVTLSTPNIERLSRYP